MSRTLSVALAQLRWSADPERNAERSVVVADEAFSGGADVVILPELVAPGYTTSRETLATSAEGLDGPTVRAWQQVAAAHGGYITAGFCERDRDRLFNSAVLVSGEGVIGHYRKAHLFSAEKNVFAPGDLGFPVVTTPSATFGLCICYDLRFVEVMRILALRGAEVVLVPSAWVGGFDRAVIADPACPGQVAGVLVQANLNQVFVAAVSFAGVGPDCDFLGRSVLAGPYGDVVAGPAPPDQECVQLVQLDLDQVAEASQRTSLVTPRQDRRRDLYSVTYLGRTL
jgi:N-carbamoylputrescine amidase